MAALGVPSVYVANAELGQPIDPRWTRSRCPNCEGHHALQSLGDGAMHATTCPLDGRTYLVGIRGRVLTTAGERRIALEGLPHSA